MSTSHGAFVWHELMTSDPAAARTFYGSVVGWSVQHSPVPGMDYWMFKAAEIPVCGLMSVPEEAKVPIRIIRMTQPSAQEHKSPVDPISGHVASL